METDLNLTEEERINAFARELGIAIRNIVDSADNTKPTMPHDLPMPLPKTNQEKGDEKHDTY